ncbi:MAG: FxLYD domain-containing protein [Pseudomonadota bacterium]
MQELNRSVFRQGIVFGFGLLIPLALCSITYNIISYKIVQARYEKDSPAHESYVSTEEENIKHIEIQSFKDTRDGNFVMVTGSVKNTGSKKISSIKLEAEFLNDKGEFVYEETEYVSKSLAPNEVENFAIKCGCTNRTIPEYAKITVRVVGASGY